MKPYKRPYGGTPGPPVMYEKPSDPEEEGAGYGYSNGMSQQERDVFYYHSDHLGSTSYITDRDGNATQFVCYKPYGEALVDVHNTSYEQPWKFNGKELDSETGLYYYGARYYEPVLALWYGVDALAEKYPNKGGYVYCAGNPVRLVDPDGNDWYMASNKDVSTPVYFEGHDEHDGYTNIGESVCAIYTDGNQRNFNADGTITTQTPLSEVLVTAPHKDDINRVASTFASSGPDAAGIQLSLDFCVVIGAGVDVRIGQTRSGEHYLSLDVNAELGLDIGISAGAFIANYSHGDNTKPNYSPNSMQGEGFGAGVGMGLSYNYSKSKVTPNQIQNEDYHKWTTHSIQMCGGELGGNVSIGKTFVPLTW